MKISTVNVIEYDVDTVHSVTSFADNDEGNKEAEVLFSEIAKKQGAEDSEMDLFLEDGYYEQGTYQLFLAHSA